MILSNYIVYDVETGGLDPKKNPITQFACVILDGKTLKELDRFETFVKPYNDLVIDKDAIAHTQVTMSDIKRGVTLEELVGASRELFKMHQANGKFKDANRLVPVGHNVVFDNSMLVEAFRLCGYDFHEFIMTNFIDTFPLAKLTWGVKGNEKLNLSACVDYANIRITDAHGAMNDVEATADLLRYYAKKLRSKRGDATNEIERRRLRGQEFFEFKCGAK